MSVTTAAGLSGTATEGLPIYDDWPRERMLELQRERLRDLVRFAVSASPYYRGALGPDAVDARLEELPSLSKATLMAEFDRIATDPRLRLADVERHTTGPRAGSPFLGEFRLFATSGTSGLHGLVVYTHEEFALWVDSVRRALRQAGARPDTRVATIGAPNPLHVTRRLFEALRPGGSDAPVLAVTTPLAEIVRALNAYRPEALAGYASIVALLAAEQLEGRLDIEPKIVFAGSEVLTAEAEQRMLDAWSIRPFDVYASTETLMMAVSSPAHVGLHVLEDLVVLESVDERGRPVPAGTAGYKVLVTNLVNRAQPLIRYELSDSIVLAPEPDPTGRPYARVERIDGRSDDILRLPARAGGEVSVHPYLLRAPFSALPEVTQYQIVEEASGLRARVVLRAGAGFDTAERVQAELTAVLAQAGAACSVTVEPVESIAREPGHAAKLKLVKRSG
jgi:putative adenylate-forming enzyme